MAEDSIDVLMRVVVTAGSPAMLAENLTDFAPLVDGDTMVSDFKPGQFCELKSFDFAAGAESSLSKESAEPEKPEAEVSERGALERARRERVAKRDQGDFVDMQEVSFERLLDSASPLLFKALVDCTTLASISIVKRKGAGVAATGLGYLRLDFEDVLITQLQWEDNEDVMLETGKFIYRKLTLKYLSQKADGSLVPGSSATWKMKSIRTGG